MRILGWHDLEKAMLGDIAQDLGNPRPRQHSLRPKERITSGGGGQATSDLEDRIWVIDWTA
jgi:hypothetical protein